MSESPSEFEISILLSGGPAEAGEVALEDYRVSLDGWQSLIELGSRIYFLGDRASPTVRGVSPFSLRVRAPQRGSVDTVILLKLVDPAFWAQTIVGGIVGNALWDLLKRGTPSFVKWLGSLCHGHVEAKRRTPNLDAIVENLRVMIDAPSLPGNELARLAEIVPEVDKVALFEDAPTREHEDEEDDISAPPRDARSQWLRQVVESVDTSLEEATRPISGGCTSVELIERRDGETTTALYVGESDREVVLKPLAFGGEDTEWRRSRIRFRRIDRESGSVMFRFDGHRDRDRNQYGYIADKSYHRPHNPYTQALDADSPLHVWLHEENTDNGGTRYAIRTAPPPKQLTLKSLERPKGGPGPVGGTASSRGDGPHSDLGGPKTDRLPR